MEAEVLANLNAMYSGAFANLINIVGMVIGGLGLFAGFHLYYQNKINEKAIDSKLNQLDEKLKLEYEKRIEEVSNEITALKFHHGCVSALSFFLQAKSLDGETRNVKRLKEFIKSLSLLLDTYQYDEYVQQHHIDKRNINIDNVIRSICIVILRLPPKQLDESKVHIEESIAILEGSEGFSELASKIVDTYETRKARIIKDL